MSSHKDNAALPRSKETVHYQRKATVPQQSEVRQDTFHPKTDNSRDQHFTSAGKKKSVTFGDLCTEEEKNPRNHAPTAGGVTSAAKTSTPMITPTQ